MTLDMWIAALWLCLIPVVLLTLYWRRDRINAALLDDELRGNLYRNSRRGEQLNGEYIDAADNDTRRHAK